MENNENKILELEETIKKASEFNLEKYFRDMLNDPNNKLKFGINSYGKEQVDYVTLFDKDDIWLIEYDMNDRHISYSCHKIFKFLKDKINVKDIDNLIKDTLSNITYWKVNTIMLD